MSDHVADQAAGLIRRLAECLNSKVSGILDLLLNHKNAGSLGAIAGLAIAVVFTWKFFSSSSPGRTRRIPPKPRDRAPASGDPGISNAAQSSAEVHDPPELNLNDPEPAEITLRHVVKKKLSGCRKLTCQLLGVILEERTPEELQSHATVRQSVVEVLLEISKHCDLYLMETVLDDESEERILSALESAGLFQAGSLVKDKVLFCSSDIGRSSFVRQLESDWHVDTNLEITSQLARFISNLLHISPELPGQLAHNIFVSASLERYFSP